MADTSKTADCFETLFASAKLSRRNLGGIAGGAVVAAGFSSPVMAAIARPGHDLNRFEGAYAIDGHKVIEGYFVAPRGKSRLDVVLVVAGSEATPAQVRAEAERIALTGAYAVAPRLPAGATAALADIKDTARRLKGFALGNGKVRIVAA